MRLRALILLGVVLALGGLVPEAWAKTPRFRTGANAVDSEMRTQALRESLFKVARVKLVEPSPSVGAELPRVRITATRLPARREEPLRLPQIEPVPTDKGDSLAAVRELALQPTAFTPYDRYLGTVRSVIANLTEREANMIAACSLMREGRSFRYMATDPYRAAAPSLTAARRSGDCKAKALWLFEQLGDPRALYVIGKLERRSRTSHAWVYWRSEDRWWILDPTDRIDPIAADSVSSTRYVPYYSYGKAGTFRHKATSLLLASASPTATAPIPTASRVKSRSGKRQRR